MQEIREPSETRPWTKHYDPQVKERLEYRPGPVFEDLDRAAEKHPRRLAVVFQNWKITYKRLHALAETLAANLRALGVRPGNKISIMLPNLPQTIIAYFAALKCGATMVMTNPLYMEKELTHQLNDAGCETMIVLDLLWPKIEALRDKLPIQKYILTSIADCLGFPLNRLYGFKMKRDKQLANIPFDGENVLTLKPLLKGNARLSVPPEKPDETALLQYTGGTTGISKGVVLTHANLKANVRQCQTLFHDVGEGRESFLCVLPFFHIYGLTVCLNLAVAVGGTMIPVPRYVPADLLKVIHDKKPSVFPGAPAIYASLLSQKNLAKHDLSSLRYCVSGSAPCPVEILTRFKEVTGADIIEGYGLTEASPVTHFNPLHGVKKVGSIGLPLPDTDCRIVDVELGTVSLPPGKEGELVIKGPQVTSGYWNQPDETANTLRNGWLYTGDVALMDEEGYFYIKDRKKDMILSAGFNVYPREIDEVLFEHPKVLEAVAVGVPHATRGEIIKAYVVPRPGEEPTKSEIIGFCRQKLAVYKVPKEVEFREELPKTLVGKVLRRALRAEEEEKLKGE
ncbi:MAG: long-chain fatty acid--CoA ligase [Thermodesulfobacteriota bacterium]|nr:long-chain fatty acid--CoA ligase [Thermodesulfobacteriota bacterium]